MDRSRAFDRNKYISSSPTPERAQGLEPKPEVAIGATTLRCQGVDLLAAGPTAQITHLTLTPTQPRGDARSIERAAYQGARFVTGWIAQTMGRIDRAAWPQGAGRDAPGAGL